MTELNTVSHSVLRNDALPKVIGEALYTSDLPLEGLCHAVVLRSPHHHARIISLDPAAALGMEGVLAVLTAADIPGESTFGAIVQDRPVLARDRVRHMGEPIALVIARDRNTANAALEAIAVNYEELPAVLDPISADRQDAPRLHDSGNTLVHFQHAVGDLEAGLGEAEIILEETFHLPRISPAYLEPEVAAAQWHPDGSLTVWVSSQKPFEDQKTISAVLGLDPAQIQVRSAVIGGAFGGKEDSMMPILAALAALSIQGTVRLVNTRPESIQAHPKRHPAVVRYKLGARRDGTLTALDIDAYMDTGAYASYGIPIGGVMIEIGAGPYRTPNVRISSKVMYTNAPFSGAMRGFGGPQAAFGLESLLDRLAGELGLDPVSLRRKNALHRGDRTAVGVLLEEEPSIDACLDEVEKARSRLQCLPAAPGQQCGVGFALLFQAMGLGYRIPDNTTTSISWLPDGCVLLDTGTPDMGQGTCTMGAQITAERLGIAYNQVRLAELDTLRSPDGGVTCASRMTYMVGNSIFVSARAAVDRLLDYTAEVSGKPRQQLRYENGRVFLEPGDSQGITAAELASRAAEEDVDLIGRGTFTFPYPEEVTPQDLPFGMPHIRFGFGAHVARVEVDPELGTVRVSDLVAIHDVGKAINPDGVRAQIEGGAAMGIGYALMEEVKLKADNSWTDTLTEYLLPTALDVPRIESVILEHPEPSGPYGARGVAEMSLTPVAPAVVNAVADATGKHLTRIPIRPEHLLGME